MFSCKKKVNEEANKIKQGYVSNKIKTGLCVDQQGDLAEIQGL